MYACVFGSGGGVGGLGGRLITERESGGGEAMWSVIDLFSVHFDFVSM